MTAQIENDLKTLKLKMMLDHSKCSLKLLKVFVTLEQSTTFRSHNQTLSNFKKTIVRGAPKLYKHTSDGEELNLTLDFEQLLHTLRPKEKYEVLTQPNCLNGSRFVTNEYFLLIDTAYDGYTCCSKKPQIRARVEGFPLLKQIEAISTEKLGRL